jgi:hypothetical protein
MHTRRAVSEGRKAVSNDTQKMPNPSALSRFRYLFDENTAAPAHFAVKSARRKRSAAEAATQTCRYTQN